ncbi:hypothetical protein [Anaerovorax odorimutans]|uniref:hypothetical protein n=1 Tax=Anaerovorax odorimutans TaxID=109327 RepID=UPI0004896648|nr:hypothetical protein [Anaerovorax odorimutans]
MSNKFKLSLGLGGPSIIMIFVILCLTALGTLSLLTANSDWKLTNKYEQFVTSYYKADNKVEEWLADVDYTLKTGEQPESDTFTASVSPYQKIVVKIKINGTKYEVISQKLITTNQWKYEEDQNEFNDIILD